MMNIRMLLKEMTERNASDLFLRVGGSVRFKIDGSLVPFNDDILTVGLLNEAVEDLTTPQQREVLRDKLDVDFAIYIKELNLRFRVSIFLQRGLPAIVIRSVRRAPESFEGLNLPVDVLKKLSMERNGLVLLTGTMGSGKSTTIASMVEYINQHSRKHILTIEEPIEFTFEDKESLINQRELGLDVLTYESALRSFTLQSPDVLMIGNIRDHETMSSAITAAESGVLVLSTLHTANAAQSIARIINFYPQHLHQEVRNQLSMLLKGVISLSLLPLKSGHGRIPACEIMLLTPTIGRLIRDDKLREMSKYMAEGEMFGMQTFNRSLEKLVKEGKVSAEQAVEFTDNKDDFMMALKGINRKG
ncbi:MAG: PilT/PilU family type 4a pilus ATPase [Candidatus Omnitrophota bacterium]